MKWAAKAAVDRIWMVGSPWRLVSIGDGPSNGRTRQRRQTSSASFSGATAVITSPNSKCSGACRATGATATRRPPSSRSSRRSRRTSRRQFERQGGGARLEVRSERRQVRGGGGTEMAPPYLRPRRRRSDPRHRDVQIPLRQTTPEGLELREPHVQPTFKSRRVREAEQHLERLAPFQDGV